MDNYNVDELNPPSWMNEEFFEKILRKCEGCHELQIKDLKMYPATLKGDHFSSAMFRAEVKYKIKSEVKDISLILKTTPEEESYKKDALQIIPVFETEISTFAEVIPKFQNILRKYGDETVFGAKMLHSSLSPHKLIVLEDLTKKNFKMLTGRLANSNDLEVILDKICKFHAIGFKLLQEGDKSFLKLAQGVMTVEAEAMNTFFASGLELFAETLASLPDGKIYEQKFRKIQPKVFSNCKLLCKSSSKLSVFAHGDFHLNNLMFKCSENMETVLDMIMVDFQFSFVSSLAVDLIYVINMVVDSELRFQRDKVIAGYYKKFVESLKKFEFKGAIPTLTDIQNEVSRFKHFELMTVATLLPFILAMINKQEFDPEEVIISKDAKSVFYKLPAFINELHVLLPRMLKDGYFDE